MPLPKAIFFDLDDTLTNREASLTRYARDFGSAFRQHLGVASAPEILSVIAAADDRGYAAREAVFVALQTKLAWERVPALTTLAQHWESGFPLATVAREGAVDTLLQLRERRVLLGIVTNGHAHIQRAKIEVLGLARHVDCVVVSGELGYHKPDARVFLKALEALDCASGDAWFVGDHPRNDILGALGAGLRPVWLTGVHPWPAELLQPETSISALTDLLRLAA